MGKKFWIIVVILILLAGGGIFVWHRHALKVAYDANADVQDLDDLYAAKEETEKALEQYKKNPKGNKAKLIQPGADTGHHVYLYFDGLPDRAMTEEILKVLDNRNAKAAFFIEGQNGADSPETIRAISKKGQVIGNYTWLGRPSFETLDAEDAIRSLCRTQKVVDVLTEKTPSFFRAPRTKYTEELLEEVGAAGLSYAVESNVTVRRGELKNSGEAKDLAEKVKAGSLIAFEINKPLDIRAREPGKSDERPAIDMKPTIKDGDYRERTEQKDHTAEEVAWLIDALKEEGFDLLPMDSADFLSLVK